MNIYKLNIPIITGKKITAFFIALFMIICITSCSAENSDEELFGARAAYTISRHMGDAKSFTITYMEYSEEKESKKITAECILYFSNDKFEKYVFALGTGEFFESRSDKSVCDEETGLYMINYGDIFINKDSEKKINDKEVLKLFNEFIKSGDKELLGIFDKTDNNDTE